MEGNKRFNGMFGIENDNVQEQPKKTKVSARASFSPKTGETIAQSNTNNFVSSVEDATEEYNKATKSVKSRLSNIAALILGAASCGVAGFLYASKSIAYKKALAAAQYNAQIAEAQKSAVEAIHQSAVEALKTGNPLFDYNDYGSSVFPNMNGKFSKFAEANPELASKIINRVHSHSNSDVLNQYAQERGFEDFDAYSAWTNETFAHLFNENGTISADASMADIDKYYYTFVDMYNYLGDEAISFYADDIIKAGIDPSMLQGGQIVTDPFTDAAGNVVNEWTIQLAPETADALNTAANLDSAEIVGTIGIAALAGCGGYFIGKTVIDRLGNRSASAEASADTSVEMDK